MTSCVYTCMDVHWMAECGVQVEFRGLCCQKWHCCMGGRNLHGWHQLRVPMKCPNLNTVNLDPIRGGRFRRCDIRSKVQWHKVAPRWELCTHTHLHVTFEVHPRVCQQWLLYICMPPYRHHQVRHAPFSRCCMPPGATDITRTYLIGWTGPGCSTPLISCVQYVHLEGGGQKLADARFWPRSSTRRNRKEAAK